MRAPGKGLPAKPMRAEYMNSLSRTAPVAQEIPVADHGDEIVILRCEDDLRLDKVFQQDGEKFRLASGYGMAARFRVATRRFDSIEDLYAILTEISRDPRLCLIRGAPIQDFGKRRVRRLKHPRPKLRWRGDKQVPVIRDGQPVIEEATFRPAARSWLMLDLDGIHPAVWRGLDPVKDVDRIFARIRATWPEWLREASCVVQLSSSHGLPLTEGEKIKISVKLHVFMLTDRPMTEDETEAIYGLALADMSLARTVQVHYIADPRFTRETGKRMSDPVPQRWRLIPGKPRANVPTPDDPVWSSVAATEVGQIITKNRITDAARKARAIPPRSGYTAPDDLPPGWRGRLALAGCDLESGGHFRDRVMSAIGMFLTREGPDADPAPFWQEVGVVLDRAATARGSAYASAARTDYQAIFAEFRLKALSAREGRLGEAVSVSATTPAGPVIEPPCGPRRQARGGERVEGWRAGRHLDLRHTGAGKTEDALQQAVDLLASIDDDRAASGADLLAPDSPAPADRVYMALPNHQVAGEIAERARAMIAARGVDADVLHVRGLAQPDPDAPEPDEQMCRRMPDVEAALATGGRLEDICGSGQSLCPHHARCGGDVCGAHRQAERLRESAGRKAVVIAAGGSLMTHVPPEAARSADVAGVWLVPVAGDEFKAKMPEALALIADEWRPGATMVYQTPRLLTDADIAILARDDDQDLPWSDLVDLTALGTARRAYGGRLPGRIDPAVDGGRAAEILGTVFAAITHAMAGTALHAPLRAGDLFAAAADRMRKDRQAGIARMAQTLVHLVPVATDATLAASFWQMVEEAEDLLADLTVPLTRTAKTHRVAEEIGLFAQARDVALERGTEGAQDAPPDLVGRLRHNARCARGRRVLQGLRQGWKDWQARRGRADDDALLPVRVGQVKRREQVFTGVGVMMREPVADWLWNVPVTVLDATASPEIIDRWLPGVEVVKPKAIPPMPDSVIIRQIADSQLGFSKLEGDRWPARIRTAIEAAAVAHAGQGAAGVDVGVVMPKALLSEIGKLPPNCAAVTWGQEMGSNALEGVAYGLVISRILPKPQATARLAEVVFGQRTTSGDYRLVPADRLVRDRDGTIRRYHGGTDPAFAMMRSVDPRAEMMRQALTDAVFEQGLGRFRVHRRTAASPLVLDILTSHPSSVVAVDELHPLRALVQKLDDPALIMAAAGIACGSYGLHVVAGLIGGHAQRLYRDGLEKRDDKAEPLPSEAEKARLAADAIKRGAENARWAGRVEAGNAGSFFSNGRGQGKPFGPQTVERLLAADQRQVVQATIKPSASARTIPVTIRFWPGEAFADARKRLLDQIGLPGVEISQIEPAKRRGRPKKTG